MSNRTKHTAESSLALAEEVRTFFRKGAHDVQNLFHVMNFWMATGHDTDKVQAHQQLKDMQQRYAQEVGRLQRSFDEYLSIRTGAIVPTSVNVLTVINRILEEMKATLHDSAVEIDSPTKTTVALHYPEEHLAGAIRALLDNAQRYRHPERVFCIDIRVRLVEESVVLSVQDNGIGIDTDRYRNQLFKPFVRCTSRSQGQGISLHLVKTMVEQYGGRIELISQLNEGTTVTLYLKNLP